MPYQVTSPRETEPVTMVSGANTLRKGMTVGMGAVAVVLSALVPLEAQQRHPLAPTPPRGLPVSPYFDGWYANPDGTFTLSFGYFNRNRDDVLEIAIGSDNSIEPAEFNGLQPTSFPPFDYGGSDGRRERGVFAITVPSDFRNREVLWTLRNQDGSLHTVSGSVKSPAYQLSHEPMAMGAIPPTLRLDDPGTEGARGPAGLWSPPRTARVGVPIALAAWLADESVPSVGENRDRSKDANVLNVKWYKHSGPLGPNVAFQEERAAVEDPQGKATTMVVFSEPGEYVIRVQADNFGLIDSRPQDQCCWTNGYFPVVVRR